MIYIYSRFPIQNMTFFDRVQARKKTVLVVSLRLEWKSCRKYLGSIP